MDRDFDLIQIKFDFDLTILNQNWYKYLGVAIQYGITRVRTMARHCFTVSYSNKPLPDRPRGDRAGPKECAAASQHSRSPSVDAAD